MLSNKEKYFKFCEQNEIPVFMQSWWLDAVCGEENWDVILIERNGKILAVQPFFLKKVLLWKFIKMPKMTQIMGPWYDFPAQLSYSKKLSLEHDILNEIIKSFPRTASFLQRYHYTFNNGLPFYWNGFKQTTKYTYVIQGLSDPESVFQNFSHAKRKNINKAKKNLQIKFDLAPDVFYENHKETLKKQGKSIAYRYDLFKRIYDSSYQRDAGRSIYAIDSAGNMHSAIFVVWNSYSAYYLISTIDPDFRSSGSASLLIFEMIKYLTDKTQRFDFEGSMIQEVERSFRQFGARQMPYFVISKKSFPFNLIDFFR